MSSRAIRRLREERDFPSNDYSDIDEEEEEEEHLETKSNRNAAFLAMMDDDSSSSSSSSSDEDEEESLSGDDKTDINEHDEQDGKDNDVDDANSNNLETSKKEQQQQQKQDELPQEADQKIEEEDLDAILAEFEDQDQKISASSANTGKQNTSSRTSSWFQVISGASLDIRDLDIEYVMRSSLAQEGGGGNAAAAAASNPASGRQRRSKQVFLFGPPRNDWARPPHYVGGGIGMTSYDTDSSSTASTAPFIVPWPYNKNDDNDSYESSEETDGHDADELSLLAEPQLWYTFLYSQEHQQECQDYAHIQQTGDVNALALFVAHHPYVTEALLQLCAVLYQTNQSQQGLALLRRCLWIYECASLSGFQGGGGTSTATTQSNYSDHFMDYERSENDGYFKALFQLVHVSSIAGCIRTSLAISKYVLSLDPLRDPMHVLPILDHFALASMSTIQDQFVVDLVSSQRISVNYLEAISEVHHKCDLLDLPNWSYSYALALYRLELEEKEDQQHENEITSKSDNSAFEALKKAIEKYPEVVEKLLDKNEINLIGRSFQTDWPSVLPHLRHRAQQKRMNSAPSVSSMELSKSAAKACQLLVQIFVERNHKLWSGDHVVKWLYNACADLSNDEKKETPEDNNDAIPYQPSLALARYSTIDPEKYQDRIQRLPDEANPLDPALLGQAMNIDPNRRRLLRHQRNQHQQGDGQDLWGQGGLGFGQGQQQVMFGGQPLQNLDPDSPLVELFWRSLMPWNHVDGVPPPER